ncbi:MAG: PD-(D/E)XK nuclease family protein, partial [Promethearchaeota archaeon]
KKPSSKPSEPSSSEIEQYSITELVDYKKCPMFYQFRHVWEYGSLMNRFLGYGKLLHHILRRIMEQENLDLSNPRLLREKLHALMLIDFKLPYLNIEMNGKIRDSAEEKLYSYIYQFRDEMSRMKSVETRLEFIDKNVIIKGVADIIFDEKIGEINDELNGNIKGIHIRDYKTRDQHLGKLHEFQIGLYAAAFDKMDMSVLGGSIGYLRELKNEEVTINPEIIAQITKEAEEIIDHIRNNEFQPSFSQNQGKKCDNDKCDHYNICKYSNFEQD